MHRTRSRPVVLATMLASMLALSLTAGSIIPACAASPPIRIVAAENFYGDLAQRLGGPHVVVTSVLSNPAQDPHLLEISPSIARAVAGADIVIANGIGYDPWMATLAGASRHGGRHLLVIADLAGRHSGDNPHLWYDPAVMPLCARALSALLAKQDPADAADFASRLETTLAAIAPVAARTALMRQHLAGVPVTATEPIFGEMATALGLDMRNQRFQLAVMNDVEPAVSDVAAMETDLRQHRVRLLITNSQASDSAARRLQGIAAQAGIPTVAVTETQPHGLDYTQWMLGQLDAVDHALAGAHS